MKDHLRNYIIISGLLLKDNNRGTAALGYGAFSFLKEQGLLEEPIKIVNFRYVMNPFKKQNRGTTILHLNIQGLRVEQHIVNVHTWEKKIFDIFGFLFIFSRFGRYLKKVRFVAAINGGDGFSDIYNTPTFLNRLHDSNFAIRMGIPLILLPQTLGPFKEKNNLAVAEKILKYAQKVYVRDDKFVKELNSMGVNYEQTKDLSAFMLPEPWDIDIIPDSIGINVSGLAYSNQFRTLAGQFENYPLLIDATIRHFQSMGKTVYLIPHSYNYQTPETNNDDLIACRAAYNRLEKKDKVVLIDKDMISPQIKYVISKMSFFIGTRMHANFAAIYTGVPLFGMSYSYKFEGAFNANGLDGTFQTAMINNIRKEDIPTYIEKIDKVYKSFMK